MSESTVWQQTLAAEQQAVYGFGLVGGRLGPSDELAQQSLALHRERVEHCQAVLRSLGATPLAGAPAYVPETKVATDSQANSLAHQLEQACAVGYATLCAQTDASTRRTGTQWLRESAIDQFRWSDRLPALPGLMG